MKTKKLIYVLNHYSKDSHSHFYHVIHLLEEITKHDVAIALVIEKCDDMPDINSTNITVIPQRAKSKIGRPIELGKIIFALTKQGYSHIFIRISWVAAVVAIVVSFISKLKTYYWLSGQGGFENYRNLKWGIEKFKLFIVSRLPFIFIKTFITQFVTGPETMKTYFVKEGAVSEDKILVLYNDIDTKRFDILDGKSKESLKIKLGYRPEEKIIFFAHRFSPVRRTMYYVPYIFDKLSGAISENYIVVMAGSGPEETELKLEINKSPFNARIKMLGSIPNALIQEYYQISDVFINPTYAEGFPRVLIEAMASGLPFVTTDAGGIKDIVGERQKEYMVDKNDRDSFAVKLIELCKNEDKRATLSAENIKVVKRFSTDKVADMYVENLFR